MTDELTNDVPQTLYPGHVVDLKQDGKVLHNVQVTCWNETKSRYEGTVPLTDIAGVCHIVPLTFSYECVVR